MKNKKIKVRIESESLNALKEQANKRNYPLIQEYDFISIVYLIHVK